MLTYLLIITSFFTGAGFKTAKHVTPFSNNTMVASLPQDNGNDYTIIRCYITKKNNRTLSHFEIDLGSDDNHPLKKRLIYGADDLLIATTADNKQVTITSEVDALKFMSEDGWALVSVNEISVLDKDHLQYLFSRSKN